MIRFYCKILTFSLSKNFVWRGSVHVLEYSKFKMSGPQQRSITSFFSSPTSNGISDKSKERKRTTHTSTNDIESPAKLKKEEKAPVSSDDDDTPVKARRTTRCIIDSDDESPKKQPRISKRIVDSDSEEDQKMPDNIYNEKDEKNPDAVREEVSSLIDRSKKARLRKTARKQVQPLRKAAKDKNADGAVIRQASNDIDSKKGFNSCKSPKKSDDDETNAEEEMNESEEENSPKNVQRSPKTEPEKNKGIKPGVKNPFAAMMGKKTENSDEGGAYNPAKPNYHPINDAFWKHKDPTPYLALARTFEEIEATTKRLKITEILCNFFRSVIVLSPDDLLYCVYLCLNQLAPAYEGVELGIGDTIIMKAIAESTGRSTQQIKADVSKKGDIGIVAESSRSTQRTMFQPAQLTVVAVFNKLKEIALLSGSHVQQKKVNIIRGLLVACRLSEARYLARCLTGKLRIGLAEQSVLAALAHAATITPPSSEYPPEVLDVRKTKGLSSEAFKARIEENALTVKTAYCECPTYAKVVPTLLEHGIEALPEHCKLTPGVPLKPMLAHPTKGISEVLTRFDKAQFTCEYKYDGERAQIHLLESGEVEIYSRNQERNTSKYPDIVARVPQAKLGHVTSFIIDTEAVAYNTETNTILPFQVLSTRKRKDAEAAEIKVQVCVFAFDMLYLNGESLVTRPFSERRARLRDSFQETEGSFTLARSEDCSNTDQIQEFLEESIKGNCEGLMVKTLDVDSSYEIAKRSHKWLKLKKDYLEGVGDTIDVIPIGAYYGKGKRTGVFGGFLLAVYDEDNEEMQTVCKIGTGFSDEQLQEHTKFFKEHLLDAPKSYYRFESSLSPDVWLDAVQVWEIKCADLSISPVHKAAQGIVDPEKGISLRFPRFLRIREDKNPELATSSSQIADMYRNQEQVKNKDGTGGGMDEEDYY